MNILIVEDDDDIRELLALLLAADGNRVEVAIDGVDALARLRAGFQPSLILLDMMMPRLDGEGLIRAARRDPRWADIPVVVLSGDPAAGRKAAALGVAAFLVKPVELDELLRTVARCAAPSPSPPAFL